MRTSCISGFLCFVVAVTLHCCTAPAEMPSGTWHQFRGPTGDGITVDQNPPVQFGEDAKVKWKTQIQGKGWSSPVIADGRIWMTTAVETMPTERQRREILSKSDLKPGELKSRAVALSIGLKLVGVDFESGSIASITDLVTVNQPDMIHTTNSYASPTPVIDGNFIYCHFGTYGTLCVDRKSREIVWQKTFPLKHSVGPGGSPIIHGDKLVFIQDGLEEQYVVALDKRTGRQLWRTDRPPIRNENGEMRKAYCTPVPMTDSNGREQLICSGSQWIVGLQPDTGKELWRIDHGSGFSVVPKPIIQGDLVIFATGFSTTELWAVRADGSGDVSDTHVVWTQDRGIPTKSSPLLLDEKIYLVDDNGVASCVDLSDGSIIWKSRLGGKFSASPVLAGGKLYIGNHDGEVFVIQPADSFQLVQTNQVDGQIMASPAVTQDALILRTDQALYRFQ